MRRHVLRGSWRLLSALLALVLCLSACGEKTPKQGFTLYFRASDYAAGTSALLEETWREEEAPAVESALRRLLDGPSDPDGRSPFPAGTRLQSWTLEDGLLTVDFSEEYGSLSDIGLTVADCCVVLTMTQLEDVERVTITAAGVALPGRSRQELTAEDVLLLGGEGAASDLAVQLYFPRVDGSGLGTEYRELRIGTDADPLEAILDALCAGPVDRENVAFLPESRDDTRVEERDGLCTVFLGQSWLEALPQSTQRLELAVYSLVNSLAELDQVDRVQVLYEGQSVWGDGPLEPDYQLSIDNDG